MSYSQLGQDLFVDNLLGQKYNGVFVDVGAHDGCGCSNTLFFEESRNWTGICIEPGPNEFKNLSLRRKSININACVSDYDGESNFTYIEGYSNMLSGLSESYNDFHKNRILNEINHYGGEVREIKMKVYKLQTILDLHKVLEVDYCSIDTEGSEFNIVKSIDFDRTNIKVFSIENNYNTDEIRNYLIEREYVLYAKLQWDDIFVKKLLL